MAKKKVTVEVEILFPRNLYKNGGPLVWGKKEFTYSTVLVEDEKEMDIAMKEGYLDDFSAAIFNKVESPKKKEDVPEKKEEISDDDF